MDETTEDLEPAPRNPRKIPCPICGGTDYSWGKFITSNGLPDQFLFFRPLGANYDDGDQSLFARKCEDCGNIQIFYQ